MSLVDFIDMSHDAQPRVAYSMCIYLNGATAFDGFFLQWDFRLGSAAAAGKASGPLGGVGSGPQVEKMVEAMDSWNGLCLDYRCSVFIGASTLRPILKRLDKSSRLVEGRLINVWLNQDYYY